MKVKGAPPDLLVAGGILWLAAVGALILVYVTVVWAVGQIFGECVSPGCPDPSALPPKSLLAPIVLPAVTGLCATLLFLVGLLVVARRRPGVGYPIIGAIGFGVLILVVVVGALSREPLVFLLLAGWPGWSGIAFLNAAWRARQRSRRVAETHPNPGPTGYSDGAGPR